MDDPITAGYPIPYLIVSDGAAALEFYGKAFGAEEVFRLPLADGSIAHAEIRLGGWAVYLASETPEMATGPVRSPDHLGGTGVMIHRYVADVDAAVEQARTAGATVLQEPTDQFYGDRSATVADPFGHQWSLATHVKDVSPEEMTAAMQAMGG